MTEILIGMPPNPQALERLRALPDVAVQVVTCSQEEQEVFPPEMLPQKRIFFGSYPPRNLEDMPALEFVQIGSVGFSHLYGLGLAERGIRVCNARGVFDVPIAEWVVAMMINLTRDLRGMIRNQEQGIWDRAPRFQRELRGATLGIWGYGGIGRETARLAKCLGLTVRVLTRRGIVPRRDTYFVPGTGDAEGTLPDQVFVAGEEQAFLDGLDFLALAMPLTPQNTGIVGESELRALSPDTFVLNPARGPLIAETALLKALHEGWIGGAALDTHYQYPLPADHPLWSFPNVILTPHISGSDQTGQFATRIWDIFIENVERWQAGRPLLNEIPQAQLKGE